MTVCLRAADAVVLPYRRTLNSGVLLLAYTFGLPVVAPDVPGIAELLRPDTSRSFEAGDAMDLARAMRDVATLTGPAAAGTRNATLAIARERAAERISPAFFGALRERLHGEPAGSWPAAATAAGSAAAGSAAAGSATAGSATRAGSAAAAPRAPDPASGGAPG
jgi:hypothetical protein